MLPRLLRITSKVYLYDTSAPGLLDTGLLRLLRRVRWSCGQCAFALYTVPRRTDHALLLHYAAESVRLRHGCPQNTNLQQQHQHLPCHGGDRKLGIEQAADERPSLQNEANTVQRKLRSSGADKKLARYLVTMWIRSFIEQDQIGGFHACIYT